MYICPTCGKKFNTEELIQKHFLQCWKMQHPYHKGKEAPRGKDIVTREGNNEMENFLKGISKNERDTH